MENRMGSPKPKLWAARESPQPTSHECCLIRADPRAFCYRTKVRGAASRSLPNSSPSFAMRKASVNSLALSFSSMWHFVFVSSGQHFSTTLMSKTLFFMPLTSLCFSLSLHDGHLDGRKPPTHLRQNVWPQAMVTGSHIRNRQSGHSSRSMVGGWCHQNNVPREDRLLFLSKRFGRREASRGSSVAWSI